MIHDTLKDRFPIKVLMILVQNGVKLPVELPNFPSTVEVLDETTTDHRLASIQIPLAVQAKKQPLERSPSPAQGNIAYQGLVVYLFQTSNRPVRHLEPSASSSSGDICSDLFSAVWIAGKSACPKELSKNTTIFPVRKRRDCTTRTQPFNKLGIPSIPADQSCR